MKRASIFSRHQEVIDVSDLIQLEHRPWFRSPRILLGICLLLFAFSTIAWWTYAEYLKPRRDQQLFDEATLILRSNPVLSKLTGDSKDWSAEQKLIYSSAYFLVLDEIGVPKETGIRARRAALDLAIHKGSKHARLVLGKHLRDGDFGEKDLKAASVQFHTALEELQAGIKASDQDDLYVYSLMLEEGLGVEIDEVKAKGIQKRVALTRDPTTMALIGYSVSRREKDAGNLDIPFAKEISRKLISMGHTQHYLIGLAACESEFPQQEEFPDGITEVAWQTLFKLTEEKIAACSVEFAREAAKKGDKLTDIREMAMESNGRVSRSILQRIGLDKPKSAGAEPKAIDPESQSQTGYLAGTKQTANGGLSTFKIDNTRGGGDAVVRLYRNGGKPAARSMFVRNGESFTAEAIAPGAYQLRYRYIGSDETFEADETFNLTETPTETGTRFSRVTVKLYKVANGNMAVKKVDASEF
jgi:hypothetical protein